jgi:hypothetical protein
LRVVELENALYNQDKLLCKIFCENKKLNLKLKSGFLKLFLFDNCTMIMVNYEDLWLLHSRVASLLDGARLGTQRAQSSFHAA